MRRHLAASALLLLLGTACATERPVCPDCDAVVIAAVQEPSWLLPPLAVQTVERDIGDLLFERLAHLRPGASPLDTAAYEPGLADRWERMDERTWRFHLRPGARWHDGRPVTAADVSFSFAAYVDPGIESVGAEAVAGITTRPVDDSTIDITFEQPRAEQLYDATWHVRVIPRHVWDSIPRAAWRADTARSRLVGSGPFRLADWSLGRSLELVRVDGSGPPGTIRRVLWRFAADPEAALNLMLSHEADLLETAGSPEREARVRGDPMLRLVEYPSAVYGFLGFNQRAPGSDAPHPVLGSRAVRRALTQAIDRDEAARAVFGEGAAVPPGPMSRLLWLWADGDPALPFDTAAASAMLQGAGWVPGPDGVRRRGRLRLALDILVPATSSTRRDLAQIVERRWRAVGVEASVTALEFPTFLERLRAGRFDAYIGAWLDEPSARGVAEQWSRSGWGDLNPGQYHSPAFEALADSAIASGEVAASRRLWQAALDTLAADAPAVFLYTPMQRAVVAERVEQVDIDPYAWVRTLPAWRVTGSRGGD